MTLAQDLDGIEQTDLGSAEFAQRTDEADARIISKRHEELELPFEYAAFRSANTGY